MIQLCRHILPSGVLCTQAAVKETLYCRHHSAVKQTVAASKLPPKLYGIHVPLPLAFPEDRAAVQMNYFLVMQALNDRRIDSCTANSLNRLLKGCAENLRAGSLAGAEKERAVQRVVRTPEGEEIAPPRLVLEEDEAEPVHDEECLCPQCAERFHGAAPELHHAECGCGLCEETSDQGSAVSDRNFEDQDFGDGEAGSLNPVPRTARAEKLYTVERAHSTHVDSYEEVRQKYAARCEARERAAEAGVELPPEEPLSSPKIESEGERRYKAIMEQVEKNKQIANEIWERRFAHEEEEQTGGR
jgi:hypothetical protein